jgi:hypothetical protein
MDFRLLSIACLKLTNSNKLLFIKGRNAANLAGLSRDEKKFFRNFQLLINDLWFPGWPFFLYRV